MFCIEKNLRIRTNHSFTQLLEAPFLSSSPPLRLPSLPNLIRMKNPPLTLVSSQFFVQPSPDSPSTGCLPPWELGGRSRADWGLIGRIVTMRPRQEPYFWFLFLLKELLDYSLHFSILVPFKFEHWSFVLEKIFLISSFLTNFLFNCLLLHCCIIRNRWVFR